MTPKKRVQKTPEHPVEDVRRRVVYTNDTQRSLFTSKRKVSTLLALLFAAGSGPLAAAQEAPRHLDIEEIRVEGATVLNPVEIERIVYPHLGPSRTPDDVEAARAALEKAYLDKGYNTVSVVIPPQKVEDGVVTLRVQETKVGRLRVRGSQYHDLDEIKAASPSLAEGTVPEFGAVKRDLVALQSSDRKVTPNIRPGVAAGTIDVDLEVEDTLPLHGSLELNNRHNPDTKPLRLNGAIRYDNLWQLGHSVGFSFQTAPERPDDAKVFSAYYLAKSVGFESLSLMLSGTKQDSDVNTLGNFNVAGRGEVVGLRAILQLPAKGDYIHSLSGGFDYKHFDTDLSGGGNPAFQSPITYFPFTAEYTGTFLREEGSYTQILVGSTWHLRGMGSDAEKFEAKRHGSNGGFILFRGDVSHLQKLPEDFELFASVQGQLSPQPLISNEQFGLGGLTSVRGYYESELLGDSAIVVSGELRTPSITLGGLLDEWRGHIFAEWGGAIITDALPGQQSRYELASAGIGTRARFGGHFSASADLAFPMLDGPRTESGSTRITFTVKAEF